MNASFFQELGLFDCAVLQWIGSDKFKVLHDNDTWFTDLFSNKTQGDICVLNNEPFFLVDFLYDANEFWSLKADGRISSGIWSEQTVDNLLRLEASAIFSKGNAYLVLFNMEGEFNKRQGTLQSARELLLSNDKVLEQHDLIRARVESLTSGAERQESSLLKLRNVADNAEFGIAIFDKDMSSLHQNPALYNLFEMQSPEEPSNLLLDLCRDQFPELQRILLTGSLWNGELYWLKPPALSRWLQLTICPLKNEMGDNLFWLFLVTDITREKYLKQSNEKLTYFDSLTNLPNRQYFWQYLERLVGINQDFYVMILDVKHLKRTNEAFGFAAGDIVLKEIVSRIAPLLNTNDIFSRIGGNEFAVIIRDVSQHRCKLMADNMISVVSEPYYVLEQCQCNVGLSIGAAHYPDDGVNAEDLMKYADLASFSAKQNIKSSIQFYSTDLKDDALKRMDLESALREAIEKEQFELYLQPILDLASGRIVQAEVLLRWDRPGVGMVSPAEFIPVAEQTGLIVTIGKWVIKEAISLLTNLHRQQEYIKLSVNLSPAQVSDNGLLHFIKKSIVSSGIDASYLELELTEGVLVNDFDRISEFLVELRALGITIAIDDFGTGYSSLSYLQKLPIDFLKIDQSFIFELIGNDSNQAIVQAIIGMAKSLKLKVIAEGVETEAQRDLLKEYHCQLVQGYLFSKPLEYKAFCALLNR